MRILAAILAVALLAGAARAGDLPGGLPVLRIEPGMHTAPIRRIGVNAACTLMVTGSDDKTARLWALPQGGRGSPELLRTLRVPIGEGNEGKVYAVALSPDGKWVTAGGYSKTQDHWAYIFEAATGRLVTRLGSLGNAIFQLAFSPDGSRLAATLAGGEGMRLWETANRALLAVDKEYGGKDSYGAAFDSANKLYTVAAASPGGEDLIGWHVNRGRDRAPDFYPVSRFRDSFNRPDVVQRVLDDLDEDTAIAKANLLSRAKPAEDISNIVPQR
jgi:hypothetical protein